jgi:hypothetical protein
MLMKKGVKGLGFPAESAELHRGQQRVTPPRMQGENRKN